MEGAPTIGGRWSVTIEAIQLGDPDSKWETEKVCGVDENQSCFIQISGGEGGSKASSAPFILKSFKEPFTAVVDVDSYKNISVGLSNEETKTHVGGWAIGVSDTPKNPVRLSLEGQARKPEITIVAPVDLTIDPVDLGEDPGPPIAIHRPPGGKGPPSRINRVVSSPSSSSNSGGCAIQRSSIPIGVIFHVNVKPLQSPIDPTKELLKLFPSLQVERSSKEVSFVLTDSSGDCICHLQLNRNGSGSLDSFDNTKVPSVTVVTQGAAVVCHDKQWQHRPLVNFLRHYKLQRALHKITDFRVLPGVSVTMTLETAPSTKMYPSFSYKGRTIEGYTPYEHNSLNCTEAVRAEMESSLRSKIEAFVDHKNGLIVLVMSRLETKGPHGYVSVSPTWKVMCQNDPDVKKLDADYLNLKPPREF